VTATKHKLTGKASGWRELVREMESVASRKRAASSAWFFKTGKGQYGEGDRFLGITVPLQRRIALRYRDLPFAGIRRLLASPIHEHRAVGLEILVAQYERGDDVQREKVFRFYLQNTRRANNWDLVDGSAPYIVGEHLKMRQRGLLDRLATSEVLWERRIAIVSTLALIKHGEIKDTYRIAEKLLADQHDLIHKAVGWALRETGKVSRPALLRFLRVHFKSLPRTSLRYAIERFPQAQRKRILAGNFARTAP
jgi:3-methyladenine DNA glycosylase AlkD